MNPILAHDIIHGLIERWVHGYGRRIIMIAVVSVVCSVLFAKPAYGASSNNYEIDVDEFNGGGSYGTSDSYELNDSWGFMGTDEESDSDSYLEITGLPALQVFCGNTILEPDEVCDDGNYINCDGCTNDCSRIDNVCGDGIVECGEECDDGNVVSGDGCSGSCVTESQGGGSDNSGYSGGSDTGRGTFEEPNVPEAEPETEPVIPPAEESASEEPEDEEEPIAEEPGEESEQEEEPSPLGQASVITAPAVHEGAVHPDVLPHEDERPELPRELSEFEQWLSETYLSELVGDERWVETATAREEMQLYYEQTQAENGIDLETYKQIIHTAAQKDTFDWALPIRLFALTYIALGLAEKIRSRKKRKKRLSHKR